MASTKPHPSEMAKLLARRLNCVYDESARSEPAMVSVAVPKAHSLLIRENDDPLQIPELWGLEWVAKSYGPKHGVAPQLENKMARLLLLRIGVEDGKWTRARKGWNVPSIGIILLVHRWQGTVDKQTGLESVR